ncbi:hypothetical protein KW791_01815 [Candidatus Parcubacteria bacterium]|nr:hypothetical protein [Candidatus Parcubacteria bacterium]
MRIYGDFGLLDRAIMILIGLVLVLAGFLIQFLLINYTSDAPILRWIILLPLLLGTMLSALLIAWGLIAIILSVFPTPTLYRLDRSLEKLS